MMLHTLNLSSEGLFVRTSTPCQVDDRFRITLEEIGAVAEVRVRWVRQQTGNARSGMALEILEFAQGADAYESFLEKSTQRSGEHALGLSVSDRPPKSGPPPRG